MAVPVIIRAEPGRFGLGDTDEALQILDTTLQRSVANGLRATVQTGNLLTGSLFISLDHFPDEAPGQIGDYRGYPTIPTRSGGLQRIERQVAALLEKVNALPLDETLNELNATVAQAQSLLASIEAITSDEATRALPEQLRSTLAELEQTAASFAAGSELYGGANETLIELNQTLASIRSLAQSLEDQPNQLLFAKPSIAIF